MKILPSFFVFVFLTGCAPRPITVDAPPAFPKSSVMLVAVPREVSVGSRAVLPTGVPVVTYATDWSLTPPFFYRFTSLEEAPTPFGPWLTVTNEAVPEPLGMSARSYSITNSEYPKGYPAMYATNIVQTFSCTWVSTNVDRVFLRTAAREK